MTEYIKLFRSAKSIDISHIHFIEADPSILRSMAVLQKIEHEVSTDKSSAGTQQN